MSTSLIISFGILLPFLGTLLGTLFVLFCPAFLTPSRQSFLNTFAAGVMTAAAVWSLLLPSISLGPVRAPWLPACIGFISGALFILLLELFFPCRHKDTHSMLFLAVTLHNFPEGMAVGVAMAGLGRAAGASLPAALSLSLGIAIQNIPEGAIVYAPLRAAGKKKSKAFWLSLFSGIVETAGAVIAFAFTSFFTPLLPYVLSFAAGAMVFVVADDMIPSRQNSACSLLFCLGFALMMLLDVAFC